MGGEAGVGLGHIGRMHAAAVLDDDAVVHVAHLNHGSSIDAGSMTTMTMAIEANHAVSLGNNAGVAESVLIDAGIVDAAVLQNVVEVQVAHLGDAGHIGTSAVLLDKADVEAADLADVGQVIRAGLHDLGVVAVSPLIDKGRVGFEVAMMTTAVAAAVKHHIIVALEDEGGVLVPV